MGFSKLNTINLKKQWKIRAVFWTKSHLVRKIFFYFDKRYFHLYLTNIWKTFLKKKNFFVHFIYSNTSLKTLILKNYYIYFRKSISANITNNQRIVYTFRLYFSQKQGRNSVFLIRNFDPTAFSAITRWTQRTKRRISVNLCKCLWIGAGRQLPTFRFSRTHIPEDT